MQAKRLHKFYQCIKLRHCRKRLNASNGRLRHTFATNLVNEVKQADGTIKALSPKQVADLLGHSTSQITEMYYVKKDTARLSGITDGFEI